MKKVIFLFALILGFASTTFAQSPEIETTLDNEFSIILNTSTSRTGLLELKNELATYGIVFMYNPSFDVDKNLNGIKVRVIDSKQEKHEYVLNPMKVGDKLYIERKMNSDNQLEVFVGEK